MDSRTWNESSKLKKFLLITRLNKQSADTAMFFGEDQERMSTDCFTLNNAGSLELLRVA